MILERPTNAENFYKEYVTLINGILKLTDKEIDIVAELLRLYDTSDNVFSTENRKKLSEILKITDLNLNNHFQNLKKKGVLVTTDGELELNNRIIPELFNGDIVVAFRLYIR